MKINGVTVSGGGGSSPTVLANQTILASSWIYDGTAYYTSEFINGSITGTSIITFVPSNESALAVSLAQMLPEILPGSGKCQLHSLLPFNDNIIGDFIIQ